MGYIWKLFQCVLMWVNNFFYSSFNSDFWFWPNFMGSFLTCWPLMGYYQSYGRVQQLLWGLLRLMTSVFWVLLYHVVLRSCWWWVGVPSNYFVLTQLQLWLFWCWGCGCYWAVTISAKSLKTKKYIKVHTEKKHRKKSKNCCKIR